MPVYYERYVSWEILGLVAAIKLSVFALFGFYNRWWRYVSTRDMWGAARGVLAASFVTFLIFTFFEVHVAKVPRTVWAIDVSAHARARRRFADAGADDHRAAAEPFDRRARQRGDRRRGGGCGPADAEGDAAHTRLSGTRPSA